MTYIRLVCPLIAELGQDDIMKRFNEGIHTDSNPFQFQESMFQSWEDGIRNTGKNLGILRDPLNYYIIADGNILQGL